MRVGPNKGNRSDPFRKNDRVSIRAEFKVTRKKRFVFRGRAVAEMPDLQFSRHYPAVGQLSAQTHDCSQPKLHLVPIRTVALGIELKSLGLVERIRTAPKTGINDHKNNAEWEFRGYRSRDIFNCSATVSMFRCTRQEQWFRSRDARPENMTPSSSDA